MIKKIITYAMGATMLINSATLFAGCEKKDNSSICNHTYDSGVVAVVTPATCTTSGEGRKICDKCSYATKATIDAIGHSFGEYMYNNDATDARDGTKTATCERVGCNETNTIVAEGTKLLQWNRTIIGTSNHLTSNGNGATSELNFNLYTGTNGEGFPPGITLMPDVRTILDRSNTDSVLRAVVSFKISLSNHLTSEEKQQVAAFMGKTIDDNGCIEVDSLIERLVVGNESLTSNVYKELYLLKEMYNALFIPLQRSALYNGWVYRESNTNATNKVLEGDSSSLASSTYYVPGKTQYSNTPIAVTRNSGLNRVQYHNIVDAGTDSIKNKDNQIPAVSYNAFYFRGWQTTSTETFATADGLPDDPADWTYEVVNRGIDGYYEIARSNGSIVRERYLGGGRVYHATRAEAAEAADVVDVYGEWIIEGRYGYEDGTFVKYIDPLGQKYGDYGSSYPHSEYHKVLNISTPTINASGQGVAIDNTKDSWQTSGVTNPNEDMMCVLNTSEQTVRIPLFTMPFVLPTTWLQDACAKRHINISIDFQTIQADYLASGSSHHCSVELAESRFDDVTQITEVNVEQKPIELQPTFTVDYWKED